MHGSTSRCPRLQWNEDPEFVKRVIGIDFAPNMSCRRGQRDLGTSRVFAAFDVTPTLLRAARRTHRAGPRLGWILTDRHGPPDAHDLLPRCPRGAAGRGEPGAGDAGGADRRGGGGGAWAVGASGRWAPSRSTWSATAWEGSTRVASWPTPDGSDASRVSRRSGRPTSVARWPTSPRSASAESTTCWRRWASIRR